MEQTIVIVTVLVPLWIVLVNRLRAARWTEVPGEMLNGAWRPREVAQPVRIESQPMVETRTIHPYVLRGLPVIGLAGLIVWVFASPFHTDAPPIDITRSKAERIARDS